MLKKDKLMELIEKAEVLEERAIPLLNKHIAATLGFSGLTEQASKAIADRFEKIVVMKTKHVEILKGIKEGILKGSADVY